MSLKINNQHTHKVPVAKGSRTKVGASPMTMLVFRRRSAMASDTGRGLGRVHACELLLFITAVPRGWSVLSVYF